jgi:hypothetical protein
VLRHDKEDDHFDVSGYRAIKYSVGIEGSALEDKIDEVAEYVRNVLNEEAHEATVFPQHLTPLGQFNRDYDFKPKFRDIEIPDYYDMFDEATSFIGLQGVSLLHFARQDYFWNVKVKDRKDPSAPRKSASIRFPDFILAKMLLDAVNVRVVMMHEDNPALPHLLKFLDRESFGPSLAIARDEIKRSFAAWSQLKLDLESRSPSRADGRKGKIEVIQLVHGVVNYRLTLTDKLLVVSPYFNIYPFNSAGPTLIARESTPFYQSVSREFTDRAVSNQMAIDALAQYGSLVTNVASESG